MPRWWERLKANLGGYFWMPCPVCGACNAGMGQLRDSPGLLRTAIAYLERHGR